MYSKWARPQVQGRGDENKSVYKKLSWSFPKKLKMLLRFLLLYTFALVPLALVSQWQPGSVYREYVWTTPEEGEAFLRVGGRYGYKANPGKLPPDLQSGDQLILPHNIDLRGAVRAEVSLEKVLSHEDSRNLRIEINGHPPISVPEPDFLPDPATEYMYHTDLTVPIPLNQLKDRQPVQFRLSLDTTQRWNWPQNLLYGLIFRIYYPTSSTPPTLGPISEEVSSSSYLTTHVLAGAVRADYILVGKDVDWSGRGQQQRKHWQTYRGHPHHTIGSSRNSQTQFAVRWNTEWLPDQDGFGVQARVLGSDGKYRVSPVVEGLHLAPRPYRVLAYTPETAPRNWVTRSGEFEQLIKVPEEVSSALTFQLHWVSWSPCYSNGLFLNDHLIWDRNEDCYVFATHSPTFTGHTLNFLHTGDNVIRTALTPLFRGEMVHGMEVQWPGVQLKVKYGYVADGRSE